MIAGPPQHLNQKGIERKRKWIEEQTGSSEVRGGDYPVSGADEVSAVLLLSEINDVPRIRELKQVAVEAQDDIEEIREESTTNLDRLVNDDGNELDPLL